MLALLFPGQGSHEVGMGRDVFEASPAARAVFESADLALGFSLSRLIFEGPDDELTRTEIQQPAILTTSIALLRALERGLPTPADNLAREACLLERKRKRTPDQSTTQNRDSLERHSWIVGLVNRLTS